MKFEQKINELINDVEVPECISPENIAIMLRQKTSSANLKPFEPQISMKSKKKAIAFRSSAAIAAGFALVLGVMAFVKDNPALPIGYLESAEEIKEAENYADVYKVIQDAFVKNGTSKEDNTIEPDQTTASTTATQNTGDSQKSISYDISGSSLNDATEADILKTDGNNLYYIANGSLYIVSANGGKMTLLSKVSSTGTYPVEMYINGNRLIVISNNTVETPYETAITQETAASETTAAQAETSVSSGTTAGEEAQKQISEGDKSTQTGEDSKTEKKIPSSVLQTNTFVEIYDISDKAAPKIVSTYKQNGSYISSKMQGNAVYLVTSYSGYQTKPLDNKEDLDNYVPAYYINDAKNYIQASDICIPSQAGSTSYAIVSGLDVQGASPLVSIKAVLSNAKSIYFSDSYLYIAGSGNAIGDKNSTLLTRFSIKDGTISYSANASVEGAVINSSAMNENSGNLRLVTLTTDSKSGKRYSNIFILGSDFKISGSLTGICADKTVSNVLFEDGKVVLMSASAQVLAEINLSDNEAKLSKTSSSLPVIYCKYSDDKFAGISGILDKSGNVKSIKLSMYDSNLKELSSVELDGALPDSFSNDTESKNVLFFDSQSGLIGIPAVSKSEYGFKNLYYLVSYGGDGLKLKGKLEYNDVEQNSSFNRAIVSGDILYAFSNERIVSAQLSDLKVIEAFGLN